MGSTSHEPKLKKKKNVLGELVHFQISGQYLLPMPTIQKFGVTII